VEAGLQAPLRYPHNIFLEIGTEGGWLVLAFFAWIVFKAFKRARMSSITLEGQLIFALLSFFILNALVSGDLNDNRLLFVTLSLALTAGPHMLLAGTENGSAVPVGE
jgi:O-antigen ligase